jgi:class 3 adenylate cyclase
MENQASPPSGTVTFLLTDIEGNTRLWEQHPEALRQPDCELFHTKSVK